MTEFAAWFALFMFALGVVLGRTLEKRRLQETGQAMNYFVLVASLFFLSACVTLDDFKITPVRGVECLPKLKHETHGAKIGVYCSFAKEVNHGLV